MNKINAEIVNIQNEKNISLIKLKDKHNNIFSVLMLDFDNQNIHPGLECYLIFKESEVMVAHTLDISARNKFRSKVKNIEEDSIFARIGFDFCGETIYSLITKEAKNELDIKINDNLIWFVKSNEIILEFYKGSK